MVALAIEQVYRADWCRRWLLRAEQLKVEDQSKDALTRAGHAAEMTRGKRLHAIDKRDS